MLIIITDNGTIVFTQSGTNIQSSLFLFQTESNWNEKKKWKWEKKWKWPEENNTHWTYGHNNNNRRFECWQKNFFFIFDWIFLFFTFTTIVWLDGERKDEKFNFIINIESEWKMKKKIFFHIEIQFNYDIIIIIDMNSENRERTKIKMSHFSTKFQNFFSNWKKTKKMKIRHEIWILKKFEWTKKRNEKPNGTIAATANILWNENKKHWNNVSEVERKKTTRSLW